MTTVTPATASATGTSAPPNKTSMAQLGQADFLKLLTVELKQQDPTNPVDEKQMLAQMAQFSSLAGISDMNQTLKAIAVKLGVDPSSLPSSSSSGSSATTPASGTTTA